MDRRFDAIFDDNAPPGIFFVEGLPDDEWDEEWDDMDFDQVGGNEEDEEDDDDDDDDDDILVDEEVEEEENEIAEVPVCRPNPFLTGLMGEDNSDESIYPEHPFPGMKDYSVFSESDFSSQSEECDETKPADPKPAWNDKFQFSNEELKFIIALVEDFDPNWTPKNAYSSVYAEPKLQTIVKLLESESCTELNELAGEINDVCKLLELLNETDERVKRSVLQSLDLNSKQRESVALGLTRIDYAIKKQVYRLCRNSILFNDCDPIVRLPDLFKVLLSTYTLPAFHSEPSTQTSFDCALSYCQAVWLLKYKHLHLKPDREVAEQLLVSCDKFMLPSTWIVKETIALLQTLYAENAEKTAELVNSMPEAWLATVGVNFGPFIQFDIEPEIVNCFPNDFAGLDCSKSLLSNALDFEQQNHLFFVTKGTLTTPPSAALECERFESVDGLNITSMAILYEDDHLYCHPLFTDANCDEFAGLFTDQDMVDNAGASVGQNMTNFVHNNKAKSFAFDLRSFDAVVPFGATDGDHHESDDMRQHLQPYWPHCPIYIVHNKLHVVHTTATQELAYKQVRIPLKRRPGHGKYIRFQAFCIDKTLNPKFGQAGEYKYNNTGYFSTNRGIFAYQENSRNEIRVISKLNHRAISVSATNDGFLLLTKHNVDNKQTLLYYRATNTVELVWSFFLPEIDYEFVTACPNNPNFCLLGTFDAAVHTARISTAGLSVSMFRQQNCWEFYARGFTGINDKYVVLEEEWSSAKRLTHPYSELTAADVRKRGDWDRRILLYSMLHRRVAYEGHLDVIDMQADETKIRVRLLSDCKEYKLSM